MRPADAFSIFSLIYIVQFSVNCVADCALFFTLYHNHSIYGQVNIITIVYYINNTVFYDRITEIIIGMCRLRITWEVGNLST